MTQKFNYEGYTVCVTFRSENALSMTASYNLTGEHFINDMIQLGKIKKDTVIATLSRKSQKNLWCKFQMIDSEPRKLRISFVVNFDYLPQFSEDVNLQYMEIKGEALNKISSTQLQSDIDEIQKILDSIKTSGTISLQQKNSTVNNKTAITQFNVNQGAYLLQISGVITNAAQIQDSIQFFIKQNEVEQQISLKQKSHTQYGYGYPYYFTHKIQTKGGKIEISAKNSHSGNATLTNQIITLIPVIGNA